MDVHAAGLRFQELVQTHVIGLDTGEQIDGIQPMLCPYPRGLHTRRLSYEPGSLFCWPVEHRADIVYPFRSVDIKTIPNLRSVGCCVTEFRPGARIQQPGRVGPKHYARPTPSCTADPGGARRILPVVKAMPGNNPMWR